MFWTVTTFGIMIGVLALAFWPADKGHKIVYDCKLAEIIADIPVAVKEECKKRGVTK